MTIELPANVRVLSGLAEDDAGFDVTDPAKIAALSRAEDAHFWHLTRNELIEARLRRLGVAPPARVFDIGCGGGCVTAHLARAGYRTAGVEGHASRIREAALRAPEAEFFVHDLRAGVDALPGDFDAAGLFDVIEHLDDPAGAVRAAATRVRPGGWVVGTVPALMLLWSEVDVTAGHRLRYDAAGVRDVLDRVPELDRVQVSYFNRLLVPAMWARRRARSGVTDARADLAIPPAPVNAALANALRLERAFGHVLRRVPGASLWFAARRRP